MRGEGRPDLVVSYDLDLRSARVGRVVISVNAKVLRCVEMEWMRMSRRGRLG